MPYAEGRSWIKTKPSLPDAATGWKDLSPKNEWMFSKVAWRPRAGKKSCSMSTRGAGKTLTSIIKKI